MSNMVTTDSVILRIKQNHLLDANQDVAADTELLESGLVDSLGVVALVAWLEDEASVKIDPIEVVLENFQTPQAIAELMRRLGS